MNIRAITVLFVLVLAVVAWVYVSKGEATVEGTVTIRLGDKVLKVDRQYLAKPPLGIAFWSKVPGLDKSRPAVDLKFTLEQLHALTGEDILEAECLQGICIDGYVWQLTPAELERSVSPMLYRDAWFGEDSFTGRVVEEDPKTGYFKIFRKVEYPYSWELMRFDPEVDLSRIETFTHRKDYWLAGCLRLQNDSVMCSSEIFVGDLSFEIYIEEDVLPYYDSVYAAIAELIESWIVSESEE